MILAIDTATRFISLALHDGKRLLLESTWLTANNHSTELSPAIRAAFVRLRLTPASLVAIAVAQGPGSFTGLRIGMGVAKGIALAQGIPLIAVPTLEIVAAAVPPASAPLIALVQAGRGRVCAQRFHHKNGSWTPADAAKITTWDELFAALGEPTLVAGEVDEQAYLALAASHAPAQLLPAAVSLRRAGYLAQIAWARLTAGQADDPHTVVPIYLHQPGVPHP
ncbi:MAG: tRNA (adenosine(37)-N6)-threonylcarbamoyltransferase complex dimerization subunit type 1 TsaB [Anaerolineae bacterium]